MLAQSWRSMVTGSITSSYTNLLNSLIKNDPANRQLLQVLNTSMAHRKNAVTVILFMFPFFLILSFKFCFISCADSAMTEVEVTSHFIEVIKWVCGWKPGHDKWSIISTNDFSPFCLPVSTLFVVNRGKAKILASTKCQQNFWSGDHFDLILFV